MGVRVSFDLRLQLEPLDLLLQRGHLVGGLHGERRRAGQHRLRRAQLRQKVECGGARQRQHEPRSQHLHRQDRRGGLMGRSCPQAKSVNASSSRHRPLERSSELARR
eukprot:scaffold83853_cov51-Phaeocystis_antarctica.AAC.2